MKALKKCPQHLPHVVNISIFCFCCLITEPTCHVCKSTSLNPCKLHTLIEIDFGLWIINISALQVFWYSLSTWNIVWREKKLCQWPWAIGNGCESSNCLDLLVHLRVFSQRLGPLRNTNKLQASIDSIFPWKIFDYWKRKTEKKIQTDKLRKGNSCCFLFIIFLLLLKWKFHQ